MAKVVLAQLDATEGIYRVNVGALGGLVVGREHRPSSRYFVFVPDPANPGSGDLHEVRGENFDDAARLLAEDLFLTAVGSLLSAANRTRFFPLLADRMSRYLVRQSIALQDLLS